MIIRKAELETVCGITSTLPENLLPEFAFAGKSNVGPRRSIFTMSMMICILLIFRVTDMQKYQLR